MLGMTGLEWKMLQAAPPSSPPSPLGWAETPKSCKGVYFGSLYVPIHII